MNYCGNCGHSITLQIPAGDDRERHCCNNCGSIHYFNPRIIVACLPTWKNKIMLCKRGIEPRLDYWTLPGGFMEQGETTEEGAIRETWEETRAEVEIEHLHGIYNMPQINQVYFIYKAAMKSSTFETTPESTEIKLVEPKDIPWNSLAFTVMKKTLEQYVQNVPSGNRGFHHDVITLKNM